MSSVLSRAREEAMKGGGGDWLDNDTLIANQHVFYITDVRDDRGGGFMGNDRWLLRVEPYYQEDEDPEGLVSLTDNPARRKFMGVLDQELEELVNKGEDPVIGPCCLVRLKGKNYRYIEIVDYDETDKKPILPQGAILAGARPDEDMRPRPVQRPRAQREPEQQAAREEPRPFAGADAAKAEAAPAEPPFPTAQPTTDNASARSASTGVSQGSDASSASPKRRSRAATTEQSMPSTSSPTAPTAPGDFPTIMNWAREQGLQSSGRPSRELRERYAAAKSAFESGQDSEATTPSVNAYQGSTNDVSEELAHRAAEMARTEPAMVPVSAPNRPTNLAQGEAPAAREVLFRAGMAGTTIEACPSCGIKIHDRIFPTTESVTGYALVHTRCSGGGEQQMMDAIPDPAEAQG